MDKCIRCGFPIVWGIKYVTLKKGDEIVYMCKDCYEETHKEAQKQAKNAK